jgi:hypothetical protein
MESQSTFSDFDVLSEFLNETPERSPRDALLSYRLNAPVPLDAATKLKRLSKTLHLDRLFWEYSIPSKPTSLSNPTTAALTALTESPAIATVSTMNYSEQLIRNYLDKNPSRSMINSSDRLNGDNSQADTHSSRSTVYENSQFAQANLADFTEQTDCASSSFDCEQVPEIENDTRKFSEIFEPNFTNSNQCESMSDYARDCFSAPGMQNVHNVKPSDRSEATINQMNRFGCPSPEMYTRPTNPSENYHTFQLRRNFRLNSNPFDLNRGFSTEPRRRRPPSGAGFRPYVNAESHCRGSPFSQFYRRTKSASPHVPFQSNCLSSPNFNACDEFGCYKRLERCACGFSTGCEPQLQSCCKNNVCEMCSVAMKLEVTCNKFAFCTFF